MRAANIKSNGTYFHNFTFLKSGAKCKVYYYYSYFNNMLQTAFTLKKNYRNIPRKM